MKISQKGFTLVELVLAVAILAFALTAILGSFLSCNFLDTASRNLTVAISHAEFVMENIRKTDFSIVQGLAGTLSSTNIAAIVNAGSQLVPLPNETIVIGVSGTDPLDIIVTVNWQDAVSRNRSTSLEVLLTKRIGYSAWGLPQPAPGRGFAQP